MSFFFVYELEYVREKHHFMTYFVKNFLSIVVISFMNNASEKVNMNTFQVYAFDGLEFIIVFVEMASILID